MVAGLETGDPEIREEALSARTRYSTPEALLSQALDAHSDFWRAVGDPRPGAVVIEDWSRSCLTTRGPPPGR